MIDEYPILAVAASFAQGETRMRGLSERAAAFILAEGPRERGTDVR